MKRWRKILVIPAITMLTGLILMALGIEIVGEYWYKASWVLVAYSLQPFGMVASVELFLWLSAPGYIAEVERRRQAAANYQEEHHD